MQINGLAQALGVSASTLRHWENELAVELGQRTHPPAWVEYFRQVKALLDACKKYEQIQQELQPPQAQLLSEPPPPVVPPAELAEMKAAIARLEMGLQATGTKVATGQQALAKT